MQKVGLEPIVLWLQQWAFNFSIDRQDKATTVEFYSFIILLGSLLLHYFRLKFLIFLC